MNAIKILDEMPVVLIKDPLWRPRTTVEPGAIILLPRDAVVGTCKKGCK